MPCPFAAEAASYIVAIRLKQSNHQPVFLCEIRQLAQDFLRRLDVARGLRLFVLEPDPRVGRGDFEMELDAGRLRPSRLA